MKTLTIIILAFLVYASNATAQKSLRDAKDNLSKSSSSNGSSSSSSSSGYGWSSSSSSESNSELSDAVAEVIFKSMIYATYGLLIGNIEPRSFNEHPYAKENEGEYQSKPRGKQSQITLSNTVVLQSHLVGNDLKLNYRFLPFLGVEVNNLYFIENSRERTNLGINSFMLNFYRIRENSVSGYWGVGATYVGSGVNTTGFTYDLGLDIYVANPVSLGFSWKQAFINSSTINEFRALTRYHLENIAIHGGFTHYKIGGINYPSGVIGLEVRF